MTYEPIVIVCEQLFFNEIKPSLKSKTKMKIPNISKVKQWTKQEWVDLGNRLPEFAFVSVQREVVEIILMNLRLGMY